MNAVSLGPFVLAADRFATVLGALVFILVAGAIARRIDRRFDAWTWWVLIGGVAAARLGHVAINWRSFADDPLRAFALWQGGFYWPAGLAAIALSVLLVLRTNRQRAWALASLAAAFIVWNTTWQLVGGTRAIALPTETFETLAGADHSFLAGRGTPQVINLWATWCPPCRREMPMMADVAATTDGVGFVFANQGETADQVRRYLADAGISLETVLLDRSGALARHYAARGLPATLFLDAEGTLSHAHVGEISREVLMDRIAGMRDQQE
ncbi:prolipoprotein diacylglyceryl transferase family protein [Microbaculum sp. FT89]|uniref:prolipoprotein diacylglyceryl transferase family protein n=1 Tax=Microbaculum sp. FT89 TaxID=3447298 RepID=UPI003F530F4A